MDKQTTLGLARMGCGWGSYYRDQERRQQISSAVLAGHLSYFKGKTLVSDSSTMQLILAPETLV